MMRHKGTLRLKSERLVLRRFTIQDVDAMFENWASDENVVRYLRWPVHKTRKETSQVLNDWTTSYENPAFYQWAICLGEYDHVIGSISVVGMNEKTDMLHIGYCIGSKWWNRGITSEALRMVLAFLLNEVCAKRIETQHDPANAASGRVMQKCGMVYEGTLRKADLNQTGIVDACMYSLLAEDWNTMNSHKTGYTPQLESTRCILRPFVEEDAQDVFTCWEHDPEVASYMFWHAHDDIRKTETWVHEELKKQSSPDWYRWAVVTKQEKKLIGTGLLYREHENEPYEIAYNFGRDYWGFGYASEVMREIMRFAHDHLGVDELIARYAKENVGSAHVLDKLGFVYDRDIDYMADEGSTLYEGVLCRCSLKSMTL